MHRSFRVLAPAGAVLLAVGCGSTVQGVTTSGPGVSGQGLSVQSAAPGAPNAPAGALPGQTSGGATAPGSVLGPGGTVTGPAGTGSSSTGLPGGTTSSASVTQAGDGPGVTATTIYTGEIYDPDAAAADQALGASGINPGDTKAETEALLKYINAHGGIAHRKVVPVWYKESANDASSTTDQRACATWTQDNKSFLLLSGQPILDQCAASEGAVGVNSGVIAAENAQIHQKYPADVNLTGAGLDTSMTATINGLAKQGYFANGAKVGIATWDAPEYAWSIQHAAVPALAAVGQRNVPVKYIHVPQSYGDLGSTSASVQNAVLSFQTQHIDHVLLFDGLAGINNSGILVIEWMNQAESQQYRPRYGLNSTSGFNALNGDVPQAQQANSVGVGWLPFLEAEESDWGPSHWSAQTKLCLKIMADAGQAATNNNQRAIQIGLCDRYFFFKRVLDPVKGPLNQATAMAAINAIGGSYHPGTTFGIFVDRNHHSAVTQVRNVVYVGSCQCYRYSGAPYNAF